MRLALVKMSIGMAYTINCMLQIGRSGQNIFLNLHQAATEVFWVQTVGFVTRSFRCSAHDEMEGHL